MKRLAIRVLVYEGDEDWVDAVLGSSKKDGVTVFTRGTLTINTVQDMLVEEVKKSETIREREGSALEATHTDKAGSRSG
uniref:Uncharacterized protein n=1 Tax=viral metagenome TaxID=1070528 RepID=A0A6M3LM86_9ZZZZ